ncbi:hypothetical protein Q1695_005344 [Nippostrongylus brasiliensis]|nr:hypothetical protein Q1695_005344 [Nippostrongylus brasiliensis]
MEFQEVIEIDANLRTDDVKTQGSFESLMISPSTVTNLKNHGYRAPSPVQMKAIPTGLTGLDMLVQAKSGTGKTLVFSILAIENLNLQCNDAQKLIIAPTREIATQIKDTIKTIAHFKTRIALLVGGTPVHLDVQSLKRGAHIVVGTAGRICQMVQDGNLSMKAIDLFVLDEADKLMDDCFQKDINYLFSALPPTRQVAVFSATYPRNLDKLLAKFMRDASLVRLNSEDVQLIGIKQYAAMCNEPALEFLVRLLKSVQFNQALVFCNLHQQCEPTCSYLEQEGFLVASISAQMTQTERDAVIEKLKQNKLKVLVSTDLYFLFFLTARGIDATNVNMVVNLETAINAETYFHRIGRAARFGGYGAAVTILADSREISRFKAMAWRGGVNARLLNVKNIPPDLTTSQPYYDSCPPFKAVKKESSPRNGELKSDLLAKSEAQPVLYSENIVTSDFSSGSSYDRETFFAFSTKEAPLSEEKRAWLKSIGLLKSDFAISSFAREVADLGEKILQSKDPNAKEFAEAVVNEKPKKYKFIPSREKAKKKFYMRGELLAIRDAVTAESWRQYAVSKLDMSCDPFLSLEEHGKAGNSCNSTALCGGGSGGPLNGVINKKQPMKNGRKCYSRKDMIAIQNSVPKKVWIPYVKSRWDTTEEPFELDQYLRCSFEERLRRQRQLEKRQRTEVMKSRQKAQMEKPKLLASARTHCQAPVAESSFESFCARVKDEFQKFSLGNSNNLGAVVPIRDLPEVWRAKVAQHTSWLQNFDTTFKYDVYKESGRRREVAVETDSDFARVSEPVELSECKIEPLEHGQAANLSNDPPTMAVKEEPGISVIHEQAGTNLEIPTCSDSKGTQTPVETTDDESVQETDDSISEESCSDDNSDFDETEEQLKRLAEAYRKNVDFQVVFSSYLSLYNLRYR